MQLHSDFSKRAIAHAADTSWVPSPLPGVERKMLERTGGEVARATTIVRYAPGSSFSAHTHTGGEEFLVLDGIFSDEHGDYGRGMYVRNPVGSKHTPFSADGCTILVKLWQYPAEDQEFVRINTHDEAFWEETNGGVKKLTLHETDHESVEMRRIEGGNTLLLTARGGAELFIYEGSMDYSGEQLEKGDWLRLPVGDQAMLTALEDTILWLKTGHLVSPPPLP